MVEDIKTGMQVVVDGYHGDVIFDPSEEVLIQTKKKIQEEIGSFMV